MRIIWIEILWAGGPPGTGLGALKEEEESYVLQLLWQGNSWRFKPLRLLRQESDRRDCSRASGAPAPGQEDCGRVRGTCRILRSGRDADPHCMGRMHYMRRSGSSGLHCRMDHHSGRAFNACGGAARYAGSSCEPLGKPSQLEWLWLWSTEFYRLLLATYACASSSILCACALLGPWGSFCK